MYKRFRSLSLFTPWLCVDLSGPFQIRTERDVFCTGTKTLWIWDVFRWVRLNATEYPLLDGKLWDVALLGLAALDYGASHFLLTKWDRYTICGYGAFRNGTNARYGTLHLNFFDYRLSVHISRNLLTICGENQNGE